MFYSKSTGGFYDTAIHGANIPADAVEITAELHQALMQGQSFGEVITANDNGSPTLSDPPLPTAEQVKATRTAEIKATLAEIDAKSIRPLRGADTARLAELEAQAYALRKELSSL